MTGTQLGVVSCSAPLLLAALPTAAGLPTPEPVLALEAWLTCALNVVAGIFFVVGSYVILGASYRALAPNLVFVRAHMRDLPFWGSTCYLVVRHSFCCLLWHRPLEAAVVVRCLNGWLGGGFLHGLSGFHGRRRGSVFIGF